MQRLKRLRVTSHWFNSDMLSGLIVSCDNGSTFLRPPRQPCPWLKSPWSAFTVAPFHREAGNR
jgi:hypothetical protein